MTPPSTSRSTTRLAVLFVAILGSLSLAFVVPHSKVPGEAAIAMALPADVSFWGPAGTGDAEVFQHWKGEPLAVSDEEKTKLAQDTEFEKKSYLLTDPTSGTALINPLLHGVQASIVLSGHDLNASIHRPERCLPAQGFKDLRPERRVVKTKAGDVPISRIRCYTEVKDPQSGQLVRGADGQPARFEHVFYYWFVGNHSLTASHYDRTLTDMRDRLLEGFDQRWAYVLVGTGITEPLAGAGFRVGDPAYPNGRSERQADALLEQVVSSISRESVRWERMHP